MSTIFSSASSRTAGSRQLSERLVLQLAATARRQAVISARIEGKIVPATSRLTKDQIFAATGVRIG